MYVLLTYGSREDIEPMVGPAVRMGVLGAEVRVCVPPDLAELVAAVGVSLVPIGEPARLPAVGGGASPARGRVVPAQFDTVAATAKESDAPVAASVMPAGVRR